MSSPLPVGVALAVACLAYVLYPIVGRGARHGGRPPSVSPGAGAPLRDVTDDEIEAAIRSYRVARAAAPVCPACGLRPEPDAVYCSSCGRRLDA